MLEHFELSPAIGSRVEGIDLHHLDDAQVKSLRKLFLERGILAFPGQHMQGADVATFARRFGELWISSILKGMPGEPAVIPISNPGKSATPTEYWHYDSTYTKRPPAMTILSALRVPACGGDTMWCNQYALLDTLTPAMQHMLRGLRAVHYDRQRYRALEGRDTTQEHSAHPVVRTHPETGRAALFISGQAEHFEGMTREESRPLLDYLLALLGRPDLTCRHRWKAGDLLMWDNRCTTHYAIHDYGDSERLMHRVTLEGEVPV